LLLTAVVTLSWSTAHIARLLDKEAEAKRAALDAEAEAARAAERARAEADNARRMFDFLVTTFKSTDALGLDGVAFRRDDDRGTLLPAGVLLGRGVEQANRDFEDRPLLRAQLLDAVGNVYRSWGNYGRARELLEEALRLRRAAGAGPLDLASSLHS